MTTVAVSNDVALLRDLPTVALNVELYLARLASRRQADRCSTGGPYSARIGLMMDYGRSHIDSGGAYDEELVATLPSHATGPL